MKKINKASGQDHSDCDCILIAILSHGKLGYIYAKDKDYSLESILNPFTAERCPTLKIIGRLVTSLAISARQLLVLPDFDNFSYIVSIAIDTHNNKNRRRSTCKFNLLDC